MIYVGIDPGLGGAVAVIGPGHYVRLYDVPILMLTKKREYDLASMVSIFSAFSLEVSLGQVHVALELVHAMPGQGVTSMFTFGRGTGLWEGILAGLGLPYTKITPQRWKKAMLDGMPKEKDASVVRAKQLFPGADLRLKKHHGRADALLIAEYLRRTLK